MTATHQSFTQTQFPVALEHELTRRRMESSRSRRPSTPESTDIDLTIDEAGAPWLPNADHESDGESPLRLTLARATPGESGDGAWQPLVDRVRLASGKRVPGTRYRIIRWLGEGGMGMVFEALHVDIQRPVALKILKPGVAGAQLQRDRFLDEARAVAQVDSRFVVDVLDFGELPDGRPFYTMELLDPISLYDELRAGPLTLERTLPILRQCCKALAAVHAQGLAHRDVKPQNILLQTEDGRTDAVRIVDFGIASKFDSQPRIAGTAMYMAPEQIRGVDFDGRLDIYGLGCVAYELLTGVMPFEGASAAELVRRHLDDPLVPPSARIASLPPALDAVLGKCLAKDPEHRFATMHELEAALCEVQIAVGFTTAWDDLPLPAIADNRRADLRRRMPQAPTERRRFGPRLIFGLGALAIGLFGLIGTATVLAVQANPRTHSTEISAAMSGIQATTEAARVAGSRAYWAYPPAGQPDYPTALRMITSLEREPGALGYVARAQADELREEFAATLVRLGDQYWSAPNGRPFAVEYYAQALLFDDGQPRARERTRLTPAQLADVASRAADGELSAVEVEVGEVLRALADADPERRRERVAALLANDQHVSSSIHFRSQLSSLAGVEDASDAVDTMDADPSLEQTPEEPGQDHRSARKRRSSTSAPSITASDERRARAHAERAQTALARGERDRAERLFVKALASNPRLETAHAGLAEIHFARGHYQQAMSAAHQAARADPSNASVQLLLGDSYLKTLRYDDARRAYNRARALGHDKATQRLQQLEEVLR